MSVALKHPPGSMTVAEFLEWDSGDLSGRRWQLVDGEPVAMAPPGDDHSAIQSELGRLLGNHLLQRGVPCRAGTGPGIIPNIHETENWRIPDLGVTCTPPTGTQDMPNPVLLVEILSPSNYRQTRANIWTYTTLPSVREILLVHSTRIGAELLRRNADGHWPKRPQKASDGESFMLDSIGLTLPVRALYRTTSLAA
jgi:Uma2 family endonuclease